MPDMIAPTPSTPASTEAPKNPSNETQTGAENAEQTATDTPDVEPWKKVKHKYKPNGKEVEVDYDELIKRAEKADGAENRFREISEREKTLKTRLEKLKDPQAEDFNDLIELIGFDKAKKFADKLVWESLQWDELPDHEKRRILAEQEASEAKGKLKEREDKDKKAEQQQLYIEADRVINQEIDRVLDEGRKSGLSMSDAPDIREQIIDEMLGYINYMDEMEAKGLPITTVPPSHEDVLRKIEERQSSSSSAYVKRLSAEQLMKILTKEQLSAIRQAEIDQLYAPIPNHQGRSARSNENEVDNSQPSRKSGKQKMTTDEYFKNLEKRWGG